MIIVIMIQTGEADNRSESVMLGPDLVGAQVKSHQFNYGSNGEKSWLRSAN